MVFTMRAIFVLAVLFASAAGAQAPMPAAPALWQPTAPYVTPGQDEPGYRNWYVAAPWHGPYIKSFNDYLVTYGVGGVLPTWQLLRTASDWQKCGAQPFEVPPTSEWPNVVAALRYIGAYIVPRIGPVEAVSVYRNPVLNACARGAAQSTHRYMGAIDLVPLRPVTREALMAQLCAIHRESGEANFIGLGFYKGLRFHVDAKKYRDWGAAGAKGGYGCGAVLAEGAAPFVEPAPAVLAAPVERGAVQR